MSDAVFATRLGHTPRLNMHQAWECAQLQPTRFHHGVRGAGDRDASHLERHVISPLLYLGLHMRLCDHRFVRHLQQNRRVIPRLVSRCGILLTCRTIGEPSTPADILRIPSASVSEKSLLPASSPSAVCNECLTVLSTMTTPIDSRTNPLKRHGGLIDQCLALEDRTIIYSLHEKASFLAARPYPGYPSQEVRGLPWSSVAKSCSAILEA